MNKNELNGMVDKFIKQNGSGSGKTDAKAKERVQKMLGGLDEKQAEKLKSVLGDPQKTQEILNSPAAKALMKKLMK